MNKISNPTFENEKTGYFTISSNVIYQVKDFIFDWVNPWTNEHIVKQLPWRYVIDNMVDMTKSSKEKLRRSTKCTQYYRIHIDKIMNYE